MGVLKSLFVGGAVIVALGAILLGLVWQYEPTPPKVTEDGWWGRGDRKAETDADKALMPFTINVPDSDLVDLKTRLQNARFKEDLEDRTFNYGFRSEYMKEVVSYWKDKFDWRKQEKILNSFNHFKTKIEGIDIHYIHARPQRQNVRTVPLLMVHGWPGSVWEFYKIIPMLTNPSNEVVFELICPSIPGYGYSEAPHKPGFDQADAARVFVKLMKRLGHEQFYVQGGDWGAAIVQSIAQAYPQNVLGLHTNMPPSPMTPRAILKQLAGAVLPAEWVFGSQSEADKLYPWGEKMLDVLKETGYMHIQATKPDTVGLGLNDSPVALGAYILEKIGTWTSKPYRDLPDGGTTRKFTLDELLTNVMIYWTNQNAASSMRFYKEFFASEEAQAWMNCGVHVPAGVASFPGEFFLVPRTLAAETLRDIVQFTEMPRGGHFAAWEEPRLLADDVTSFVSKVEVTRKTDSNKQQQSEKTKPATREERKQEKDKTEKVPAKGSDVKPKKEDMEKAPKKPSTDKPTSTDSTDKQQVKKDTKLPNAKPEDTKRGDTKPEDTKAKEPVKDSDKKRSTDSKDKPEIKDTKKDEKQQKDTKGKKPKK